MHSSAFICNALRGGAAIIEKQVLQKWQKVFENTEKKGKGVAKGNADKDGRAGTGMG